jgi:hypothetical protein
MKGEATPELQHVGAQVMQVKGEGGGHGGAPAMAESARDGKQKDAHRPARVPLLPGLTVAR